MTTASDAVRWHEVECAGYAADLALWEELADSAGGPVLELGCGTGRVALHLARAGHDVTGIDAEPTFVAELNARAEAEGLSARADAADVVDFELGRSFGLVLAPMQLIQLLPDRRARSAALRRVTAHLAPGGTFAAALVEDRHVTPTNPDDAAPLPDVREHDGWVYSSLPRSVRRHDGQVTIERLRQAIAPGGEISEQVDITHLSPLSAAELVETEGRAAALRPAGTREVVATHWHVGSTVVVLEGA